MCRHLSFGTELHYVSVIIQLVSNIEDQMLSKLFSTSKFAFCMGGGHAYSITAPVR